jgi:hypothetical protein
MRYFVQYHNPSKMGYEVSPKELSVQTDKGSQVSVGDTIWLITGKGTPRRYFLCNMFTVETVCPQRGAKFSCRVSGSHGKPFNPPIRIDEKVWFEELRKRAGNFAFGLQSIRNPSIVKSLQNISERAK